MAESTGGGETKAAATSASRYVLDPKLDACLDLSIRRFLYSTLAGASAAVLFFRSRNTRWASVAFGAGTGIGSAYSECYYILDGSFPTWLSKLHFRLDAFSGNEVALVEHQSESYEIARACLKYDLFVDEPPSSLITAQLMINKICSDKKRGLSRAVIFFVRKDLDGNYCQIEYSA